MAVYRILEDTFGQDGNQTATGDTTYTRVMTVEVTLTTDGPEIIFDNPSTSGSTTIPSVGDSYDPASGGEDVTVYCTNVRTVRTASRKVWRLIASYSKRKPTTDDTLQSPDVRRERQQWDTVTTQVPVLFDIDGQPIVNTAEEPFDPALTTEDSWLTLRLTKYVHEDDFVPTFYLGFENKVNTGVWNGFKKRQVKIRKITAPDFHDWGAWWFAVTIEFEIRYSRFPANNFHTGSDIMAQVNADTVDRSFAWTKWILNRGYQQLVNGRYKKCVDPDRRFVLTTPALLALDGTQLPVGGTPLYLGFETLEEADFDDLGITL